MSWNSSDDIDHENITAALHWILKLRYTFLIVEYGYSGGNSVQIATIEKIEILWKKFTTDWCPNRRKNLSEYKMRNKSEFAHTYTLIWYGAKSLFYIYRTIVKKLNEIKYHQSLLNKHALTLVRTVFVRFAEAVTESKRYNHFNHFNHSFERHTKWWCAELCSVLWV